jgi:hypothetical protein
MHCWTNLTMQVAVLPKDVPTWQSPPLPVSCIQVSLGYEGPALI